jgi:hypothetical protein
MTLESQEQGHGVCHTTMMKLLNGMNLATNKKWLAPK